MKINKIGHFLPKNKKKVKFFAIILAFFAIFGAVSQTLMTVFAAGSLVGQTATVTWNNSLHPAVEYGDYGSGRMSTRGYTVSVGGKSYDALCASPALAQPGSGGDTGTVAQVTNASEIKLLLASSMGPFYNASWWANSYIDTGDYRGAFADDFVKAHSIIGSIHSQGGVIAGNQSFTQTGANNMYAIRDNVLSNMNGVDTSDYSVYVVQIPGKQDIMFYVDNSTPTPPPAPTAYDLIVEKKDSETGAYLSGATFSLYEGSCSGTLIGSATTNTSGMISYTGNGTICIKETSAPSGYTINTATKTVYLDSNKTVTFYDDSIPPAPTTGNLIIYKRDNATSILISNNPATVGIYSNSICSNLIKSVSTGSTGSTGRIELEAGQYYVKEITAPAGYELNTACAGVSITAGNTSSAYIADAKEIISGGVQVQLCDLDTGENAPQGSARFSGTVLEIYGNDGTLVSSITADESGLAKTATNALPQGSYYAVMKTAGLGYNASTTHYPFSVTEANKNTLVVLEPICLNVKKNKITINKVDAENGTVNPIGAGSFAGTSFSVVNASNNPVKIGGTKYGYGQRIATVTINGLGIANVSNLPYGAYGITETLAGQGYMKSGDALSAIVHGEDVSLTVKNQVMRGNLKLKKVDGDGKPMANISFSLKLKETGETKTLKTDASGVISTASNRDAWFGGTTPVNGKGALPYGNYVLTELSTEENKGYAIAEPKEFSITSDGQMVELGNIINEWIEPEPDPEPDPEKPVVPDTGRFTILGGSADEKTIYLISAGVSVCVMFFGFYIMRRINAKIKGFSKK